MDLTRFPDREIIVWESEAPAEPLPRDTGFQPVPSDLPGKVARSPGKHRECLALPLVVLLLSTCTGCFGPAPAGQFVQQAQRLHDGALAPAVSTDPDLHDYIQMVGRRVGDAAHAVDPNRTHSPLYSAMEYHLAMCPVPNVYTTGGAHIYLYSGLLGACKSEDELAAAIAHAFAHEMNLDVEHIDMRPDPTLPLNLVAWQFVTHRFTSQQEQRADQLAFDIYVKAGYDPNAFAYLLDHLRDLYPSLQSPDRTPLMIRAQEARQRAQLASPNQRRPLPVADPKTFDALRRQAASLKQPEPNTEAQVFLRAFPNCVLSGDTPDEQAAQETLRPPAPAKRLEPS